MARSKKSVDEKYFSPFAKAVRELMEINNMTQDELAEEVGKTRQTVSQYVNGISEPGYDTLVKIADRFDVSIDYLLGRTKDKKRSPSAIDDLGISEDVAEWFRKVKAESTDKDNLSEGINSILGRQGFQMILRYLRDYAEAVKAEEAYAYLCRTASRDCQGEEFQNAVTKMVLEIVESNVFGNTMNKCLLGEYYVSNLDVLNNKIVSEILRDGIVSGFSEIYASQVSREFTICLSDIKYDARNGETTNFLASYFENLEQSSGTL